MHKNAFGSKGPLSYSTIHESSPIGLNARPVELLDNFYEKYFFYKNFYG